MSKIACSFFYTDDRYNHLAELAITSFKKWHPDIDVFIFNKDNIDHEMVYDYTAGYCKFYYASTLFDKGYDKVISLGVDTITCNRLDELIDNNEDVLVSLDFNYGITLNQIPLSPNNCFNGDVVCFNNKDLLNELLYIMREHPISHYLEQGLLSQILWIQPNIYTHRVLDIHDTSSVYNCRVYYYDESNNHSFHKHYPYPFKVENEALISPLNKKIKVLHLVKGFGTLNKESFINEVNSCKNGMWNEETKKYFIDKCGISEEWFKNHMTLEEYPEIKLYEVKTPANFPSGRKIRLENNTNIYDILKNKFLKKYNKLIGVMIPTRKRVQLLKECLDSLNDKTKNKSLVELLIKIDTDDQETIDFVLSYQSELPIKTIISDRKNGYGSLNEYYDSLAQVSEAEFLMIFNDDIEMTTEGWEEKFIPYSGTNYIIAVKNERIRNGIKSPIFDDYNGNPSIPYDFYKALGTLSHHPMLDDWWVHVTRRIREQNFELEKWIDVTLWFKRPDGVETDYQADSTFTEGRQHINWNHHNSPELLNYINGVIDYINTHPDKFI